MANPEKITVTELNEIISNTIKNMDQNKNMIVVGEVSGPKNSGRHTYLTLKDFKSSIDVKFWNKQLDQNEYKHGDNVEIHGKIDYYVPYGRMNFIGKNIIKKDGMGTIHSQYELTKETYMKKGYFDNRKDVPRVMKNIGVITAKTGAAMHDFIKVLKNNHFNGNVFFYDALVQGTRCPDSVSEGINFFNTSFSPSQEFNHENGVTVDINIDDMTDENENDVEVDVVIVMRGGGETSDLMGFSDPKILEALYKSKRYTISSIGHEVDNMLSDYVANCSVGTPSMAGDLICKHTKQQMNKIHDVERNVQIHKQMILNSLYSIRQEVTKIESQLRDPIEIIRNKIYMIENNTKRKILSNLEDYRNKNKRIIDKIALHDSGDVLKNGFCIIVSEDGNIIKKSKDIFGKNVKLIHETGEYFVNIKKII